MNAFTKADAIKLVALKTNQTQAVVKDVINALVEEMQDALKMDRKVELRGFGVLETRFSKGRIGRNPSHPENGNIVIPPKRTVRFRIATEFGQAIAQPQTPLKPVIIAKPVVTAEPLHDVT